VTRDIALLEADLAGDAGFNQLVTEATRATRAMSPPARVGWLNKALHELDLDASCLARARELIEVESRLQSSVFTRQQQAAQARREALQQLTDPSNPTGRPGVCECRTGRVAGCSGVPAWCATSA
jgi:hypothetical protein